MIGVTLVVANGFPHMRIDLHPTDGVGDGLGLVWCGFCHAFKALGTLGSYGDSWVSLHTTA